MRLTRTKSLLRFTCGPLETRLLRNVFTELLAQYRLKPGEVDPNTAAAWYSTRGCQTAGMTAEETQDWLNHLQQLKGGSVTRLEDWSAQLGRPGQDPDNSSLHVRLEDADSFITALNDHRLRVASCRQIGQREMDVESPQALAVLPVAQQEALFEIHILAWLIEDTLRALEAGSGGD